MTHSLQYIVISAIITFAIGWIIKRLIKRFGKSASACEGCDLADTCLKKSQKPICHRQKDGSCGCN